MLAETTPGLEQNNTHQKLVGAGSSTTVPMEPSPIAPWTRPPPSDQAPGPGTQL